MEAAIVAVESYLPGDPVGNEELARNYPEWDIERIAKKTGIVQRHFAAPDETASDLAFVAAQKLFSLHTKEREEIDFILLCTQSPDYLLPTSACLLQHRLGLSTDTGALDFNLGCSGYIYGLGMAHGLIRTGQASKVLLLTAETYSKFILPEDRSSATIFGDAATATLIHSVPSLTTFDASAYVYGTDGDGAEHLIVRGGGMRERCDPELLDGDGSSVRNKLWMNGPEVFHFALRVVPKCVQQLLAKTGTRMEDIDLFVFHQANQYMLENLRTRLQIPKEKFYVSFADSGNTVSGTIPLALQCAMAEGRLVPGSRVVLVGFGVGFSWGATLLSWPFLGAQI